MSTLKHKTKIAVDIVEQLEQKIRNQVWQAGQCLPPIRQLASELGVSPNTVAAAYSKLRDTGLVIADGRRGTKVAPSPSFQDFATQLPQGLIDIASGNIVRAHLPQPEPAWLAQQSNQVTYDVTGNDEQLLALMRTWLSSQQLPVQELGVFAGTLDVLSLALRSRLTAGMKVWVEDPCWPPILALLQQLRLRPVPLLVDQEGCTLPLPESQVRAVILTLRAHNPTGSNLSAKRWQQWQELLEQQTQTLVLFDDYWGPLAASNLPPLVPLTNPYLYILSVSKFLGPDLRLALVNGSRDLVQDLQRQQALSTRWVSLWLQSLAAHLWDVSVSQGHLAQAKAYYQQQQSLFQLALNAQGIHLAKAEGLNSWLPVKDEARTLQALAAQGWGAQAGFAFRLKSSPAIRISLGHLNQKQIYSLAEALSHSFQATKSLWI